MWVEWEGPIAADERCPSLLRAAEAAAAISAICSVEHQGVFPRTFSPFRKDPLLPGYTCQPEFDGKRADLVCSGRGFVREPAIPIILRSGEDRRRASRRFMGERLVRLSFLKLPMRDMWWRLHDFATRLF